MSLIKFLIFLVCLNHKQLITVCEERLIYGTIDEHNTAYSIYSISLNGTAKPLKNSTFLFTSDFRKIAYIRSLQCTRNATVLISVDNRSNSKLVLSSLNGLSSFSTTFQNRDIKIRQDWLTGNLYLVTEHKIAVAVPEENSTTKLITKVVVTNPSHINDLALNPNSGRMYFSTHDKIMQANMDGSEMKEFVSNDISHPVALAMDLAREGDEKLYWMDVGKKTIEFIKLNGNDRALSIQGEYFKSSYPFLRLYEDQLVYVDENYNYKSINKNNGTVKWKWRILGRNEGDPQNFAICDERNQPIRRRNPCDKAKCSYLCALTAGNKSGFQCLCPRGKFLDLDAYTCTAYEEKLIYSFGSKLFSKPLNGMEMPVENSSFLFNLESRQDIDSLECNLGNPNPTIFLSSDNYVESFFKQFSSNGVLLFATKIPQTNLEIRQDWLTGNLYLKSQNNISVLVPGGNKTKVLMKVGGNNFIIGLALNPNSGLMYYSTLDGYIMQASMDGSEIKAIVSNDILYPQSIVLDLAKEGEEELYWMDIEKGSVESIKLDGSERRVVTKEGKFNAHYHFLNIYGDQLIYLNNWFHFQSINKYNGSVNWKLNPKGTVRLSAICDVRNQPIRRGNVCDGDGTKCSYLCVLSAGRKEGFQCLCPSGQALDLDGLTCIESKIAIASENVIKLIGIDELAEGKFETIIIPGVESIKSFCYNPKNHTLILYDSALKGIFGYDLVSKETSLVKNETGNVEDVGIDVIAQNLYWINSQRQTLEVMSLERKAKKVLRFDPDESPTELFVPADPNLGIFTVGRGWIREYSRDGGSSMLFSDAGNKPMGLSHEFGSNQFLWIEGKIGSVYSTIKLSNDAKVEKSLLLGPIRNGVINQGNIYWIPGSVEELRYTKIGSNNVSKIELDGFGNMKLIILNRDVDHMSLYLREHECSWRNIRRKNCSHICIPNRDILDGLKGECVCPNGFELGEDGLTCERQKKCNEMPTQFKCSDGTCIFGWFVCNGIKDCGENEDEGKELCVKWKPRRKLNILEGDNSNGNWWMILFLVLVLMASVCGGLALYKKIVGTNNISGSFSVIYKSGDSVEEKHD